MIFPITIGGYIYILYRPLHLIMFKAIEEVHLMNIVLWLRKYSEKIILPEFVLYSLPDAIWMYSFNYFLLTYLKTEKRKRNFCSFISFIFVIGSELGQFIGLVRGTYDLNDLLAYTLGFILSYILVNQKNKKGEVNIFERF